MKLLAIDLDGTLLRTDKTVSGRSLRAIDRARSAGVEVVIATARPPRTVEELLPAEMAGCAWVCFNGSVVVERELVLADFLINRDVANKVIAGLRLVLPSVPIKAEVDTGLAEPPTKATERYSFVDADSGVTGPVAKILAKLSEDDRRTLMESEVYSDPSGYQSLITDGGQLLQITAPAATKDQALAVLLDMRRLDWADVVAFGDDVNDCDLLEASGLGVAMGNSPDEIRKLANLVAPSNDQDGVAAVLEQLLSNP